MDNETPIAIPTPSGFGGDGAVVLDPNKPINEQQEE